MWATTTSIRIGDLVVGVRSDTPETAASVETFLAAYREAGLPAAEANHSIRLPRGLFRGRMGATYLGGHLTTRSSKRNVLWSSLAQQLSGLADPDEGEVVVPLRIFTSGDRAVLVAAPRRAVPDVEGTEEQHLGRARILPADGRVVMPPLLPRLDWEGVGASRPTGLPAGWTLAGLVMFGPDDLDAQLRHVWGESSGAMDEWRGLLGSLAGRGAARLARNWPDVGSAAAELLTS